MGSVLGHSPLAPFCRAAALVVVCCLRPLHAFGLEAVTEGHVHRVSIGGSDASLSSRSRKEPSQTLYVETLSVEPPVFVVDRLLEDADCEDLVNAALEVGLRQQPRHLALRSDQAFFLQSPAPGSLWDLWRTVDVNGDGHADAEEVRDFVRQRFHLHAFSSEDALKVVREAHELGMSVMSRKAFSVYDWDALLATRHNHSPEHFARYGSEAELRPGGQEELVAVKRLRARVAQVLGWPEDLVLPDYGEPLKIRRYTLGGHMACHLDSDEASAERAGGRPVRAISVQVFLNDVPSGGDLLLPAAGPLGAEVQEQKDLERRCHEWCNIGVNGQDHHAEDLQEDKDHPYRMHTQYGLQRHGVLVKPKRGRALLWHNHVVVGETTLSATVRRNNSLSADCPVSSGEKWVAFFPLLLRAPGRTAPTSADSAGDNSSTSKKFASGASHRHRDEF